MNRMKQTSCSALALALLGLLNASFVNGQVTKEQLASIREHLRPAETLFDKLPEEHRNALSSGALNFFHVIKNWSQIQRKALAAHEFLGAKPVPDLSSPSDFTSNVVTVSGPVQVSNPAKDFRYGPDTGFTQSETSTAFCGNNVNVGFNDSESYWDSFFASSGKAVSFDGWGNSTNQGMSYTDEGFLPSAIPADLFDFLGGDAALGCTSATRVYYGSLFYRVDASSMPWSAISVSISTNGGVSFGHPVVAVQKSAFTHFLDKDMLAANPANPLNLVVIYTDFDDSRTICTTSERVAVEVVESSNGGTSYGAPMVIFQTCSTAPNFPFVQGGQVAFDPNGNVNVALEGFFAPPVGRQLGFVKAPFGSPFGTVGLVANIKGVGDGSLIEGGIRTKLDIQGIAVDRSPTATKGHIYIAFHDSTNFQKNFNGLVYGYSDAMIAKSTNGGGTWSTVQVNTNSEAIDSYQPGVAVDKTGKVAMCWYDRRADPQNFLTDEFCGGSTNGGATFANVRVTPSPFAPIHGADDLVNPFYDGDYDTVASDALGITPGFIHAFHIVRPSAPGSPVPNADVKAHNFN